MISKSLSFDDLSLSATSLWSPIQGGITTPSGFLASGIKAGLKSSGKSDLALLLAPEGSICAGTFTGSLMRAACVDLCVDRLRSNAGHARAVLINAGQANACTGERGLKDSICATKELAQRLSLMQEEILICSTGVIGEPIPLDKLISGLDPLIRGLSDVGGLAAANAILTTDLVEKQIAYEAHIDGRLVRIGGMAKGSGMIHPNMATMLAFMSCDVGVPSDIWLGMLRRVVESSFNSITVDGDTSTNDACIAFAAGSPFNLQYIDYLEDGLRLVSQHLAKAIARDGEGANCLFEVQVKGTDNDAAARKIGRSICSSSLVKTAIHGCDPNWGRIVAAAGRAGVPFDSNIFSLWIGPYQLMNNGEPIDFDRNIVSSYIKQRRDGEYLIDDLIPIILIVGFGSGVAKTWGCDLSDQYVHINADYTT